MDFPHLRIRHSPPLKIALSLHTLSPAPPISSLRPIHSLFSPHLPPEKFFSPPRTRRVLLTSLAFLTPRSPFLTQGVHPTKTTPENFFPSEDRAIFFLCADRFPSSTFFLFLVQIGLLFSPRKPSAGVAVSPKLFTFLPPTQSPVFLSRATLWIMSIMETRPLIAAPSSTPFAAFLLRYQPSRGAFPWCSP